MKKTQIVIHVMPSEIEDFTEIINHLYRASQYLKSKDWVSIYATLNLSPELINWENSLLDSKFFIDKFNLLKTKCEWAQEVKFELIEDNSILGTTSQKRKAITQNYDQYIFLDCDIAFPEVLLKYMLETSYQVEGKYFITPQTVKLWDNTWDVLVHKNFREKKYGYEKTHPPHQTYSQIVEEANIKISPYFKFGCGWFTLYSKEILNFIGIPNWLGHYGPEDTFLMFASQNAITQNYDIKQYIIEGCYVSENYVNREFPYKEKLSVNNLKQLFRDEAESHFYNELNKFKQNL